MFNTYKTRDANLILRVMREGLIVKFREIEKPANYDLLPELPEHENELGPGDRVITQPQGSSNIYFIGRVLQ